MNAVVVLVEPAGPLNIGSVARLCANFDVSELRLVAPRCDHLCEQAVQMAVHGQSLLDAAAVFPDLLTAINDCRRTVGSCGRLDHGEIPLQDPEQALGWLLASDGSASSAKAGEHRGPSPVEEAPTTRNKVDTIVQLPKWTEQKWWVCTVQSVEPTRVEVSFDGLGRVKKPAWVPITDINQTGERKTKQRPLQAPFGCRWYAGWTRRKRSPSARMAAWRAS